MSPYFAKESFLNRIRVHIARFIIPRANAIRVVSERIKESLLTIDCLLAPVSVLPILVEKQTAEEIAPEKDLRKKYPQFDFRALIISRLAPEKNIGSAISAMAEIAKNNPKAGLIIVGDGPEGAYLKKLVVRLGLQKNIIFEGWQDDLFSYYKTADVFILPSLYEGYGMAAAEAALARCPVIMTDVGCAGDAIKDGQNGLIVPVGDTGALARAIQKVVSGGLKFGPKPLILQSKEEYLAAYKKSWEDAINSYAQ
jgi:glycosyltransferase involved in cell wall biosynthesis